LFRVVDQQLVLRVAHPSMVRVRPNAADEE
jgi:hypothetical protein